MTIIYLQSVLFTFSIFSRVESFRQEECYVTLIDFTESSLQSDNFDLIFEMQKLTLQPNKKPEAFYLYRGLRRELHTKIIYQ